jgi:2-oxoglutarate ferredoxin oxidoreductase subunit gamma
VPPTPAPDGAATAAPGADRAGPLEFRLSGSGGQGIILAATILAEVACTAGYEVVQTQSYGPEARGGASKAEVIIADEDIDYPEVLSPDIALCLSQAAYLKYASETRPGGLLIYDSGLVQPDDAAADRRLRGLPFTQAAADEFKKTVVANIVALGALVEFSGLLPAAAVEQAVVSRVPERFRELNAEAFRMGLRLAGETKGEACGETKGEAGGEAGVEKGDASAGTAPVASPATAPSG